MKIVHLMAGLSAASGVANIARRFARVQRERGDAVEMLAPTFKWNPIYFGLAFAIRAWWHARTADEIWVHCSWTFPVWFGAFLARLLGKKLLVVPEGSFDPKRLHNHAGWKKRLVRPLDRWVLRRADEVLALCRDEIAWVKGFEPSANVRFERVPILLPKAGEKGESKSAAERSLHALFLGRAEDPLKGVKFLERAVEEIQVKVRGEGERQRVGISAGVEKDRRRLATLKVDEWLQDVDAESFDAALERLVGERFASGEYRFKKEDERETAIAGARRFFVEFARKIIELSDGRCVYFAPDKRALERNRGDRARCWAEYAFHAVSSSGKIIDGRNYRERLFNSIKLDAMAGICEIISQEHCMYRLIDAVPQNDAVIFIGKDAFGGRTEVVTRLDEYGNAKANLGEVTVIVQHKRNKQTPPPKFRPLTEVVETVAKHQAAGFSPSTTVNSVANPIGPCKGAMRDVGEVENRSRTVELRIVSDHFGAELEKDWAWCDVLVLPTLSENFGLVVAEALERGKRVITTDGAPAWGEGELFDCSDCSNVRMGCGGRLLYLKGFRDGTDEERVRLLKDAIATLI